jgi:two-component system copper resistance phosphate regulon response regulator CusR
MRALLLEDEMGKSPCLRQGLAEGGFAVDIAIAGENWLTQARNAQYDLLVVDAGNGLGLADELRRAGSRIPILLLGDHAAQNGVGLLGRNSGDAASIAQVVTGTRMALRSSPAHAPAEWIRVGGLEIDLVRHRVSRGGRRVELTYKEFLLLSLLARRAGQVLSRAFIADQIWDVRFESNTNFVDVHIRRLRSKVDEPFDTRLIHTVRGSGYVLESR